MNGRLEALLHFGIERLETVELEEFDPPAGGDALRGGEIERLDAVQAEARAAELAEGVDHLRGEALQAVEAQPPAA